MMMDNDFDELMGPDPSAVKERLSEPAVVSPSPRNSNGRPPPSGAFGSTASSGPPSSAFSNPDRWNQYEADPQQLQRDSQKATMTAVAAAADRAAQRQMDISYQEDFNDRLSRAGSSLPHPEEKKSFSFSSSRGRNREETITYGSDADRVRAEAMKVLEMAGGSNEDYSPYSLRKTASGGYTTETYKGKRTPSALAGLNLKDSSYAVKSASNRRANERFTIGSDSENDGDEDLVDIINLEQRRSSRSEDKSPRINDDNSTSDHSKKSWSSRYAVDSRLMNTNAGQGNDSHHKILDEMDNDERLRLQKSARNMSWSSPYGDKNYGSPKIFGANFPSFKGNIFSSGKKESPSPSKTTNLHGIWKDVDLQSNGNSLPSLPPLMKHRGPQSIEKARKRRRICLVVAIAVCIIAIVAGVVSHNKNNQNSSSASSTNLGPNGVTFYVTGDVPYDLSGETKLQSDLASLSGDATFVVHLGNVQDASITMCPETAYSRAGLFLKTSPVPVFVLPGPEDYNNCPIPLAAIENWQRFLNHFEENFEQNFQVTHQLGNDANFCFLHSGVLFIGLHLVGGRMFDNDSWRERLAKNVQWVEEQLANYNNFRAVVLMGNARPSQQQQDFFAEVADDIRKLGKPVIYIHANQGNGYDAETYVPYSKTPNLIALQIRKGGISPPMKVSVGEGKNPFVFDLS